MMRVLRGTHRRVDQCIRLRYRWNWLVLTALFMLLSLPVAAQVHFAVTTDSVAIQINGKPFSVLHFAKKENKPFLHPFLTASGKNILRGFAANSLPGYSTAR